MRKILVMATAGVFLLGLKGAWAQKEVKPPPVPPMLESPRPLNVPETKEPAAPAKPGEEKATGTQVKSKPGKKSLKKAGASKDNKKKIAKSNKKKAQKAAKKKPPAAQPQLQPDEGPGEG